jgi:hypothetical protein
MPEAVSHIKDPAKVRAGRLGAETRWGAAGTRVVRLGDLTNAQRRLALLLIDAVREAGEEAADDAA